MRRFVVLSFLGILVFYAAAQEQVLLSDTVLLDEVVSYGEQRKYQSGARFEKLTEEQLNMVQDGGLNNLLSRLTPIYIKSDAGGLSTIHFRGTSPDHTSINFGGININSLTLGHSNLSGISSYLFDEITLQYGSSSAVNGSGAIGGALYLGLKENWTDGITASAKVTIGSFGEYMTGAKIFTGNGNWESVTRLYFYEKENNFPFNNPYTGDIENQDPVRDIQKGAGLRNWGLLQELNYKFSSLQKIKTSAWYENNWYQIQPNMQSNYHYEGTQEIDNKNLRIWSEYTNSEHFINFNGGLGYVHDMQIYDKNDAQQIGSDRFITEIQASADIDNGLGIKAGSKYRYVIPDVYAYSDSVIDYEHQLEIYISSYFQLNKNLRLTANLRQMLVSGYSPPFTPSLEGEYIVRTGSESFLKLTSSFSKSYRVPTFNDRYWGAQGNPDLKPESGNSIELGTNFNFIHGKWNSSIGLNAFYMKVKDWIEWRNFGVWQARNVQEVESKGIEIHGKACFPIGNVKAKFTGNYTFNPVEPVKNLDENGIISRQMNYIPKHMGNAIFSLNLKDWQIIIDGNYTGERFTDDFGNILPGYFLLNCGLQYKLDFEKHVLDLLISVNNIFDKDYQNEKFYAMPGRYYRFSMKYDFNLIKNLKN